MARGGRRRTIRPVADPRVSTSLSGTSPHDGQDETGWAARFSEWLAVHPRAIGLFAVPLLPLVFLGYGTDVDTWSVRVSADAIRAGDYVISRPPGAPVH